MPGVLNARQGAQGLPQSSSWKHCWERSNHCPTQLSRASSGSGTVCDTWEPATSPVCCRLEMEHLALSFWDSLLIFHFFTLHLPVILLLTFSSWEKREREWENSFPVHSPSGMHPLSLHLPCPMAEEQTDFTSPGSY